MSRGFVKEGDQEEVPMVTPRAYLPAGVENFVTPEGLQKLKEEREALLEERSQYENVDNNDARINRNYLSAKLQLLEERIRTSRVIEYDAKRQKEVAFGAVRQYKNLNDGQTAEYRIVGVDEANITQGKISFLSPLSKVLLRKKKGDIVTFKTPGGEMRLEILGVR